jgi:hypothetical protein
MTEPIDLSSLPQGSPFEDARGAVKYRQGDTGKAWGTLHIPVIQRRDPA